MVEVCTVCTVCREVLLAIWRCLAWEVADSFEGLVAKWEDRARIWEGIETEA